MTQPRAVSATLLTALGCAAGFAVVITVALLHHGAPVGPDAGIHRWFVEHRAAGWTDLARFLSASAHTAAYLVAAVAGAVLVGRRGWWYGALGGIATLAAGQAVRFAAVTAVGRPRPPVGDRLAAVGGYALPSGHATVTALAAALLCIGLARSNASPAWRVVAAALGIGWAIAVGLTRLYLGVHWPTDVLAGWLLAAALGLIGYAAVLRWRAEGADQHRETAPATPAAARPTPRPPADP